MSEKAFIKLMYFFLHVYFRLIRNVGIYQGIGNFIAMRRPIFDLCGGFDESVLVGEDAEFFRRVSRIAKVKYDWSQFVFASPRRFYRENGLLFSLKCVMWGILRLAGINSSLIDYNWGAYREELAENDSRWIENFRELAISGPRDSFNASPKRETRTLDSDEI